MSRTHVQTFIGRLTQAPREYCALSVIHLHTSISDNFVKYQTLIILLRVRVLFPRFPTVNLIMVLSSILSIVRLSVAHFSCLYVSGKVT